MRISSNGSRAAATVAFGLGWIALSAGLAAQSADTEWIDAEALASGEILVDFDGQRRFTGRIRAAAVIDAPQALVWTILSDCESAPDYVEKVLSCTLIDTLPDEDAQIFRQRVKFSWFLPSFEHIFRLDYRPYDRIEVSKVSGPLERLEGIWWLSPRTETQTLVVYMLEFDPGLPLPQFMVGATLKRDVVTVLEAVRRRAEAEP